MRTCAQKVPPVKKWVPRKAAKLEVANFRILLLLLLVQLAYLTNCSTDKHATWWNSVTRRTMSCLKVSKQFILENNSKQSQAIHYKGDMYAHVTDKEKHCGGRNLIHVCPNDQQPSNKQLRSEV